MNKKELSIIPLKHKIDSGAPTPKIMASNHYLLLLFFNDSDDDDFLIKQRDVVSDKGVTLISFHTFIDFKFGTPNNEALQGHPYYKLGLQPYFFHSISNSDWIDEINKINSIHPYYNPDRYNGFHHFILPFHDSTFECLAKDYTVEYYNKSMGQILSDKINDLILSE